MRISHGIEDFLKIIRIAIEKKDPTLANKVLSDIDNIGTMDALVESLTPEEIDFLSKLENDKFNAFFDYKLISLPGLESNQNLLQHLQRKINNNEARHLKKIEKLHQTIENLSKEIENLNKQKQGVIEAKIKTHLSEFVKTAVEKLSERASNYAKNAKHWSITGVLAVILAIAASYFYMHNEITKEIVKNDISTNLLIYISAKGILLIGAILYVAKYSFFSARAYTHEAVKCEDREHAIRFGQLYLEIFGGTVERSEVIKIFENWNISNESAFAAQAEKEYMPYKEIIEKLTPQKNNEKTDQ